MTIPPFSPSSPASRFSWLLLACLFLLATLPGCGSSDASKTLTLTGSSTIAPLAIEIARRFEKNHPGVRVDIQTGGSSRGIRDARKGLVELGMVSRDLKPEERDLTAYPIARDGVSLILHKSNPIKALSRKQIVAIYTREIGNWKEVGGRDAPITVVHKAEGRSTLEVFLKAMKLDNSLVKPDVVVGDNEQGIKTVAGNPNAIGYVSIGTALYDSEHGIPIRALPFEGVAPSLSAVQEGRFPIARTLNLVSKGSPSPLASEFLSFARSPEVQDLVRAQYFVSFTGRP
jgi:phosphate transport system substrate-binding protein